MVDRKIFLQNKFKKNYEIIGDFDLFIRLSENWMHTRTTRIYINECLAIILKKSSNLSKKMSIFAN